MKILDYTFILFTILLTSKAYAFLFSASPVVGLEKVNRISPYKRSKERLYYGVQASFGLPILSIEAELTQGRDTEEFASRNLKIKEVGTSAMLGLRSSFLPLGIISMYGRAGGQGRKIKRTITEDGIERVEEPAIYISPYAGAGIRVNVGVAAVDLSHTLVFTGRPKGSDIERRTSLGFSIGF